MTTTSVLYIASILPKLSETFVYRELLALRGLGLPIRLASVHPPEVGLGEERLEALAREAIGVYGPGAAALLRDAGAELLTHRGRSWNTIRCGSCDAWRASDIHGTRRAKVIWQCLAGLALARRVRGFRVSHIHAHMAHTPTTIAMYAACQLGIPFSFTGHAADIFRDRALLDEKLTRAKFIACISGWHRGVYQGIVPRPDADYPIIRCGVDIAEFALEDHLPIHDVPLILGVGRLVRKKGFDVLLRALAESRARGLAFRAALIGDGPERPRLECLRSELRLSEVAFLGSRPNRDVVRQLAHTDLFVLPCLVDAEGDRDGIPVVLMEAMAAGVCVLCGDLPAIRELVVDGITGRLADASDGAAFGSLLAELLSDGAQRHRLADGGRRRVMEEFSLDVNARQMLERLLR